MVDSCVHVVRQFLGRYRPHSLMFSGSMERNLPGVQLNGAKIIRRALSSDPSHWQAPVQAQAFLRDVRALAPLQPGNQQRRVVLVGIAGASGCGKSTLAKALAQRLQSPVVSIRADAYNSCTRKDPTWGPDWEQPEGVEFRLLLSDIQNIVSSLSSCQKVPDDLCIGRRRERLRGQLATLKGVNVAFVVVEGFLLFHDQNVVNMCDIKLWLDCDSKTCAERRYSRKSRNGGGQSLETFREFYDGLVWSNYLKHKVVQLANAAEPLQLDSRASAEELADTAEAFVREALKGDPPNEEHRDSQRNTGQKKDKQKDTDSEGPLAGVDVDASANEPGQKPTRRWGRK